MRHHAKKCQRYPKKRYKGGCVFCDGYHTTKELYEHRYALFIALAKITHEEYQGTSIKPVWRSKLHHDGTMFEDSFIMGIGIEKGKQITYHLPMKMWGKTEFIDTIDNAPEFDGHTSDDVLERINSL